MNGCMLEDELINRVIEFHGHWCPGLAIGIRVSELALQEIGRAGDEDVVAVVETDMCGVDAVQFLTGCTFGKGNLIHLDYGKNAFSFFRRYDGKAIRIITKQTSFQDRSDELKRLRRKRLDGTISLEEQKRLKEINEERIKRIMELPLEELFVVNPVSSPPPKRAMILESLICESCGEATMETKTRRFLGRTLCIPCFKKAIE